MAWADSPITVSRRVVYKPCSRPRSSYTWCLSINSPTEIWSQLQGSVLMINSRLVDFCLNLTIDGQPSPSQMQYNFLKLSAVTIFIARSWWFPETKAILPQALREGRHHI